MIKKEYRDLINKDIDKVISVNEKRKLDLYLKRNPEANSLYKALFRTEELLDRLPDNEPSENLKKRILNSIDYNRYTVKSKKDLILEFVNNLFDNRKIKYALTFTFGLIFGFMLFLIIFNQSNFENILQERNIFGTIGTADNEILKTFNVNSEDIDGQIKIKKGINYLDFNISLNSSKPFSIQIKCDPKNKIFNKFSVIRADDLKLEKKSNLFKIEILNNHPFTLLFPTKEVTKAKFTLKISRDKNILFEREIVFPNN